MSNLLEYLIKNARANLFQESRNLFLYFLRFSNNPLLTFVLTSWNLRSSNNTILEINKLIKTFMNFRVFIQHLPKKLKVFHLILNYLKYKLLIINFILIHVMVWIKQWNIFTHFLIIRYFCHQIFFVFLIFLL